MDALDRSFACIFGAWIGDASGSIVEHRLTLSPSEVSHALSLPGGGTFGLGPGQITDDGELTISLLRGLIDSNGALNLNKISSSYARWFQSKPFDVGGTLRKSIPKACNMQVHQAELLRRAAKQAEASQSNGCLMRVSPLAVFCHRLPMQETFTAVCEEVKLTHSNLTVQLACAFYVLLAAELIKGSERRAAYEQVKEFVAGKSNGEFAEWLLQVEKEKCDVVPHRPAGWAKIAFVYAVRFLLQGSGFLQAVTQVIEMGGDTDTNACIAGALVAAAEGMDGLPREMVEKVKGWDPSKGGIRRPKFLQVKHTWRLIENLYYLGPTSLNIIGQNW